MKYFTIVLSAVILSGCCWNTVKVPVWTPPNFEMPSRPTLQSDGNGTDGEIARKLSNDLTNMEEYTFKLENILKGIQSQSSGQTLDNNK